MKEKKCLAQIFVISACLSLQVSAQDMSKQTYVQHFKQFNADFFKSMQDCAALKNPLKALCKSTAQANIEIQQAELKASYKPTIENRYNANMTKADIHFRLANEKCENLENNLESNCIKAAKDLHALNTTNAMNQRNVEMNQAILKYNDLRVEKFNRSSSPFISTELKKPLNYKT